METQEKHIQTHGVCFRAAHGTFLILYASHIRMLLPSSSFFPNLKSSLKENKKKSQEEEERSTYFLFLRSIPAETIFLVSFFASILLYCIGEGEGAAVADGAGGREDEGTGGGCGATGSGRGRGRMCFNLLFL